MDGSFLVVQRHDGVEPRLLANDAGDVPATGEILGEHHVARLDPHDRAVTDLDLGVPDSEKEWVLPSRVRKCQSRT